jgi:hypothetical protein
LAPVQCQQGERTTKKINRLKAMPTQQGWHVT